MSSNGGSADGESPDVDVFIDTIKTLKTLVQQKHQEISEINNQIQNFNNKRHSICIKFHKDFWDSRREPGPYGERYYFCTKCNCET